MGFHGICALYGSAFASTFEVTSAWPVLLLARECSTRIGPELQTECGGR